MRPERESSAPDREAAPKIDVPGLDALAAEIQVAYPYLTNAAIARILRAALEQEDEK